MATFNFGIKDAMYAKMDEATPGVPGVPVPMPTAKAFSFTSESSVTTIFADDVAMFTIGGAETMTGEYTCLGLPEEFLTENLGFVKQAIGGLTPSLQPSNFIFQFITTTQDQAGVQKRRLYIFYNVLATRSGFETTGKEAEVTANTPVFPFTMSTHPDIVDSLGNPVPYIVIDETAETAGVFAEYKTKIFMPTDLPTP